MGYTGICLASPIAWLGADLLLVVVYRAMMKDKPTEKKQYQTAAH